MFLNPIKSNFNFYLFRNLSSVVVFPVSYFEEYVSIIFSSLIGGCFEGFA